jgi:hypothetical protein
MRDVRNMIWQFLCNFSTEGFLSTKILKGKSHSLRQSDNLAWTLTQHLALVKAFLNIWLRIREENLVRNLADFGPKAILVNPHIFVWNLYI